MREDSLFGLMTAEAAVLVLAFALLVGHACWLGARRRRQAPSVTAAATTLAAAAAGSPPDRRARDGLGRLPVRAQIAVFAELAENLVGDQRNRLAAVAGQIGLLARGERWCASRRWGQRLRGARLLTLLGSGEAVVPKLLYDPRAEVRAQAAQWVGEHQQIQSIRRLLWMLNDPKTLCRFTVKDSLLRMGRPTIEPLLRYLSETGGAAALEALELAAGVADARFLGPALRLCGAQEAATRARAATLVGSIGGAQATDALAALLDDCDSVTRTNAARALGKLGHWPAAGKLAGCLADPAWEVRRAAAVALVALDAPGELMLRRAIKGDDRFAAEMARRVLELPPQADKPAVSRPAACTAPVRLRRGRARGRRRIEARRERLAA